MPSEEEIRKIIALHKEGKSQREIAKAFDKSVGWVNGILKALNVQTERSTTKKATESKANYDRAKRLELNNKWFNKIEELLDSAESAKDLKDLAVPYGIAEDKRALLEGRPNVNIGIGPSRSIDERLEELAQRRSERKAQADP